MKRILLGGILTLLLPSLGCVGYHNGYHPSYSPGCYSCSATRHDHGGSSSHRDHDRGHGGRHHRDHDGDHDGHHHRHH